MGAEGRFWGEAGPAVSTVTVCWPSCIPLPHSGPHYSPQTQHKKRKKKGFRHRLLLQEELKLFLLICKALAIPKLEKV